MGSVGREYGVEREGRREAKSAVKTTGLNCRMQLKLVFLSEVEVGGMPSGAVKCVDIRRNTGGEGGQLGFN